MRKFFLWTVIIFFVGGIVAEYIPFVWIILFHSTALKAMIGAGIFLTFVYVMYNSEISHSNDYSDEYDCDYTLDNGEVLKIKIIDVDGTYHLSCKESKTKDMVVKTFKNINDISKFLKETYNVVLETN